MSLLSKLLFGNNSSDEDATTASTEKMQQYNPGSGLPLVNNGNVDVGGYVYGDGPAREVEDTVNHNHVLSQDTLHSAFSEDTSSSLDSTCNLTNDDHSLSSDHDFCNDDFM
mgnify:CR=1 FL=1|tara:strand:+ start:309 stop:641 length:333 start_codon:yes stop_codon:yes gene_type:complete